MFKDSNLLHMDSHDKFLLFLYGVNKGSSILHDSIEIRCRQQLSTHKVMPYLGSLCHSLAYKTFLAPICVPLPWYCYSAQLISDGILISVITVKNGMVLLIIHIIQPVIIIDSGPIKKDSFAFDKYLYSSHSMPLA